MNFWKADSGPALTGALCEFVQSPTKSNDTLDYRSDGSGTSTPPLPVKSVQISETIVNEALDVNAVVLEEVGTDLGPPIALDQGSFKKREIKCRNIRKSGNCRQRTMSPPQRPKSVEKSKIKYPTSWAEYKELGLNFQKHASLKSKLEKNQKDTKFEFQRFFNFETPSPATEAFKSHSKSVAVWIQFPYLRCTATHPQVLYSGKERGFLTRKQLFSLIPKNRQQEIEKLMKPSKINLDFKPPTARKWFSKNWTKTDKNEAKLLENSVGLSFLQIYSEEENNGGNLVSQTPPFEDEKEEGEVSDDDSHNLSISEENKKNKEEIRNIEKISEENKKNKEEIQNIEKSSQKNKEEIQNIEKSSPKPVAESLVETIVEKEPIIEPKKKSKKIKTNKISKSVKSRKKSKKKSDDDKKRKKRKNSKDKDNKQKKKSSNKNDSKKKKKTDTKPAKLEIHPDYQDDIQFFADRLDAERQLKGKTKHKTKINISLEEFDLDKEREAKEKIKVDLLKMNEEYLREQKRKNSKERSSSKQNAEETKKEVDLVLENIKQEPNSWESESEDIQIDDQLIGTPTAKPLDLEMPLNIKPYCRRDIEKDNNDSGFDIATTPKKGRWDIQSSTPTKKIEELKVLEEEYDEFLKAVTDKVVVDNLEEIKPVPAPKAAQKPLINLSLSANVTQNITLSVSTSSVQISTPNSVTWSQENLIPTTGEAVMNLSIPPIIENVATSDSVKENIVTSDKEIVNVVTSDKEIVNVAISDKEVENVATTTKSPKIDKDTINVPEILNFSIPTRKIPETDESVMNLSIPHSLAEKEVSNNIENYSIIPPKNIPVMVNHSNVMHCTDKDAFNIPLDKDIDLIESEWKQTFKPIILPMKNMLTSSKLNLEDFDGHSEPVIEKTREASPKPKKKESHKKTTRHKDSRRFRQDSPKRRRRDSSPRRKRSPLKRRNSPKFRPKRQLSPRRRRSPSPRKKSKYSPKKPRHLPDSTINDDQLPQIAQVLASQKPHEESPQRLPLDIRINQVLGLEVQQPPPEQFYQQYNNFPVRQSTYKQVGNMLQIVPVEQEQFQPPPFVSQPRSQIRQIGNMLEIVPTEMVPMEQIKTEKIDEDFWYNEVDSKMSAEAVMLQKEAERLSERENRRIERENRKKEKERRRKEREKLRQTKLKAKTEKMIKRALELEIDQMLQEPSQEASVQWPPAPLVNHINDFKGKSILVDKLSSLDFDKTNKTVQFADGVRPGEGTSPSAGEELLSPPPPRPTLPKEKRFKKTLFGKKKGKKKTKTIKKPPPVESDSEDNQPPPSPPPGSPPPHLFPPRVKVKPVNNVPAALLASIIQTAQQQQFQQFRPAINMMMAPPPPLPQGHHSQSPSLPPVSPQLQLGLSAPPPPPPPHSRHF